MRTKLTVSILSIVSFVFLIGILTSSAIASPSNKSDSLEPIPTEIEKAMTYKKTHQLKPIDINTVDIYGNKGNYIVTVPMDVWKKYETKSMQFWKSHSKEFVKKFNMPTVDPEGISNW